MLDPAGDRPRVAVDADRDPAVHGDGEGLRAAHAAQAGGERDRSGQRAAVPLGGDGRERLVGALQDALGADVDPGTRRHLAEHGQPERLEPPELLPGGPLRHQVGIGDQHPRRPLMRAEHADRLAGLHQQRLVLLQVTQRADDAVEGLPAAGRPAGPAVDDELVRVLGDLRVEVVHQHPHGRLLRPALAGQAGAAGRPDRARAGWAGGGGGCGACGCEAVNAGSSSGRRRDARRAALPSPHHLWSGPGGRWRGGRRPRSGAAAGDFPAAGQGTGG